MKYVAYYRVSTYEQGQSGLGLEAQKTAVAQYVSSQGGELLHEFTEVESGTKKDRTILQAAISKASLENAVLVVKKLDRLSRGGFRILVELEDRGVSFIESDSPHDNDLIRGIKLTIAKDEARAISERTKSALSVIKKKIEKGEQHVSKAGNIVKSLGNPQNLTRKSIDNATKARTLKAQTNPDNIRAMAIISALVDAGTNFRTATKKINEAGFRTSRGNEFSEVQTKRLYERHNKNAV